VLNRWKYPNMLGFVFMIVANGLASFLPLNNQTTAEISDRYPVLFTPAGYVFSIWGVIYLLLLGFVIFQALPSGERRRDVVAIGPWFFLSCLCNGLWIFAWHYDQIGLSIVLMVLLLASLIMITLRIRQLPSHWLVRTSFGVYLGWISVATIANVTVGLYDAGWGGLGLGEPIWAAIMIVVGLLLAAYVVIRERSQAYGLVFVWALAGIAAGQAGEPTVRVTAITAAVLVGAAVLWSFVAGPRRSSGALNS